MPNFGAAYAAFSAPPLTPNSDDVRMILPPRLRSTRRRPNAWQVRKRPGQVHVEDAAPRIGLSVQRCAEQQDPGVRDDNVDVERLGGRPH